MPSLPAPEPPNEPEPIAPELPPGPPVPPDLPRPFDPEPYPKYEDTPPVQPMDL